MVLYFKNSDFGDLASYIAGIPTALRRQADKVEGDMGEYGANLMREFIRTRGTGYRGHTGRIETGKMLRAVRVRRDSQGRGVRWGWSRGSPDYFGYQEYGFTIASRSSDYESRRDVAPMHALMDSWFLTRQRFVREANRELRKGYRRRGR
jgi:hypothetical protein